MISAFTRYTNRLRERPLGWEGSIFLKKELLPYALGFLSTSQIQRRFGRNCDFPF
jgi:hypothetical protein